GDEERGPPPKTIVLFTGDTWRWDHVSAYAPKGAEVVAPQTPHLDKLAARGWRFVDARTPVPLTLPAHTTMLAGLPPAATGVRLNTYGRLAPAAQRGFPLLPEALRAEGWKTGAFVSAAVLGTRYGLDEAFDHYDDGGLADTSKASVAERPGAETVKRALRWLRKHEPTDSVFVWIHIFEPHAPYAVNGRYAGDIEAGDAVFGMLADGLARIRGEDAAILFTSDHGEMIGELDERTHGFLLADGVLRVPFLLHVPGRSAAVRTDPADLADVAPTLADLAQVPWPQHDGPGAGRSLFVQAPADRVRFAESLYGHQLHRFAQLSAAQDRSGMLIDAGQGRTHFLPASPWQVVLRETLVPQDRPNVHHLDQALAEYRKSEHAERMGRGNEAAGGYGGGGPVTPFLDPEANARLRDPHGLGILSHYELDSLKVQVLNRRLPPQLRGRALRAALERLQQMDTPGLLGASPERAFWEGEGWNQLGLLEQGAGGTFRKAEEAYLRAFELGRKDTETLTRACGANAVGREAAMLERLEQLGRQVPELGCRYWLLRTSLTHALVNAGTLPASALTAACAAAKPHCQDRKDAARLERTCR
ncbi:MAG: sulfatase, partial [Planctomycetota bacterium]|nr:sulfatase [Planctomycetota bacterium]